MGAESAFAGLRQCPNVNCNALVFVAKDGSLPLVSFPPEVIDFDSSHLPTNIVATLEESIRCHAAGCYRASALMVRRVLEEVCADKQADGKDLNQRIGALGKVIVVPQGLIEAAHDLRLLGNDAAHIEAKTYDNISEEEVSVAIDLAKEILKAVYQYDGLVARMKALKRQ